jgi:hypothetical protein
MALADEALKMAGDSKALAYHDWLGLFMEFLLQSPMFSPRATCPFTP